MFSSTVRRCLQRTAGVRAFSSSMYVPIVPLVDGDELASLDRGEGGYDKWLRRPEVKRLCVSTYAHTQENAQSALAHRCSWSQACLKVFQTHSAAFLIAFSHAHPSILRSTGPVRRPPPPKALLSRHLVAWPWSRQAQHGPLKKCALARLLTARRRPRCPIQAYRGRTRCVREGQKCLRGGNYRLFYDLSWVSPFLPPHRSAPSSPSSPMACSAASLPPLSPASRTRASSLWV